VVRLAAEIRRARGLPVADPEHSASLLGLTVAALGFIAGLPVDTITAALARWETGIATLGEAQADLSALRTTLESALGAAGATPTLHRLVDSINARELERFTDARPPAGYQRVLPGTHPAHGRRRRPRHLPTRPAWPDRTSWTTPPRRWWPAAVAVWGALAALTASMSLPPPPQIALLPNGRGPLPTVPPVAGPSPLQPVASPPAPAPPVSRQAVAVETVAAAVADDKTVGGRVAPHRAAETTLFLAPAPSDMSARARPAGRGVRRSSRAAVTASAAQPRLVTTRGRPEGRGLSAGRKSPRAHRH